MQKRLARTGLLIALGATTVAIPAHAQKPGKPKDGPVSIAAKPAAVTFSTPVTISGRVQAGSGVAVTLMRRTLPSTTFTATASMTTAKNGDYTFTHRPPRNTYYRVVAGTQPAQQSSDLLVKVSTLVGFKVSDSTPRAGSRVRFSGIVRPRHNGRLAYIQKQSGDRWVTVARTTLRSLDASTSRYSKTLRIRQSANYRVRVLGHADHAMGISRTRSLAVH